MSTRGLEMNDTSDESTDIFYVRKRSQPINYTSDDDIVELEANSGDLPCNESNLHFDMNLQSQGEEWRTIQRIGIERTVPQHENMQEADLLLRNIDCDDPFELYKLFASDNILQVMIEETNKYAIQCGFSANRRKHELSWEPVTISEMKAFIAILLIMGIVQMPDIRLYWSENNMYGNERIKSIMKRDRFLAILKCLHFSDNTTCITEDPLNKISKIVAEFKNTFKNVLKPRKTVVIDETMIPWRGRLRFRQYIKGKRHKYGIKVYKLCLPGGYTYDFDIYAGKSMNASTYGHGYDVVLKLLDGLLFEQRVLYTDSFYSSIPLARSLLQKGTYFCGTIQLNRKFLPLNKHKKQKRGEIRSSENSSGIKFVQWTDKRTVSMITSCPNHNCEFIEGRSTKYKPDLVFDYNDAKKGVDLSDQMASYYSSLRKTIKWYKKIVIQIICGTAVVNAYYMHKQWGTRKMSLLKFRESIINGLLADEEIPPINITRDKKHFIEKFVGPAKNTRKRCRECYKQLSEEMGASIAAKKSKRVTTFCGACENQPPLCLPCFKKTHENK